MPSVPNWIAKAVVVTPGQGPGPGHTQPIKGWRATNTQVVVTVDGYRGPIAMRFRLDNLKRVGDPSAYRKAYLAPPDDPEILAARTDKAISNARNHVLAAIEKQRLQDSNSDAEATIKKLFAIRVAVDEAIARVGEVL